MDFLRGFSDCWWPSAQCTVNWEAWSAVGTTAGVLAALFFPLFVRWWNSRSGSRVLASAWIDRLRLSLENLYGLQQDFPLGDRAVSWSAEGFLLAFSDMRRDLMDWKKKLETDRSQYVELANWPNARIELIHAITDALRHSDRMATICAAVEGCVDRGDEAWDEYVRRFDEELRAAQARFSSAVAACERWL